MPTAIYAEGGLGHRQSNTDDLVNMGLDRHNSQRFLPDWRPIGSSKTL
jgi:hypothetical protein